MVQGTTPTLLFKFSVDLDLIKEWRICFYQEGKENLVKTEADCVVDENKVIYVKLTQEETFAFDDKKILKIKCKALTQDGNVIPSQTIKMFVCEMQDKVLFDVENTEPQIIDTSTINFEFETEPCGFGLDFEELYIEQVGTGGGGNITVDSQLSTTSKNPVQNKVVTAALENLTQSTDTLGKAFFDHKQQYEARIEGMDELQAQHAQKIFNLETNKQDKLTFDTTPTKGSQNPVTSGGIYNALSNMPSSGGTVSEKYELIESIKVSEEAVVQRTYPNRYKKMIIRAICTEKLPRFRFTGGAWFSEFYSINDYAKSMALYIGEIIVPGAVSEQRCLAGDSGGNPSEYHTITNRLFEGDYFDGFKTDKACYVGTTIQVYGVKSDEN